MEKKHLSTFIMKKFDDQFDENIQEFLDQIYHSTNLSQAIYLRTNALKFINQWHLQQLKQLDQRIQTADQLILNTFDQYQNKQQQQHIKCSHHLKQSEKKKIEISIDRFNSSSMNKKISFNSIDFGRDFKYEILINLSSSSSSTDIAMTICENNTLIYSQNSNELIIMSLNNNNPKHIIKKQFNQNIIIHDLCYVEWLSKCLIISNEHIYLLDYQTIQYDIIDSGMNYICGTIDNQHHIFYLIKQSTLYKYDKNCLLTLRGDQYPIADGYHSRRLVLDNKTNDYLALLVNTNDEKHYILVYSTKSLDNGFIYKIIIDDRIERKWICSNGNNGWLIRGNYPSSCLDLNMNGLASIHIFDCNEIQNIIPINDGYKHFIIRTNTEIFVLIKNSFVHSF